MAREPDTVSVPPAQIVEQHGTDVIPEDQRHGSPRSTFFLWFMGNLQYSALVVGAIPTALLGLSLGQAVVALVVGSLLGSLLLGATAAMGPRAGAPQMVQSRRPFGYYGNFVPALLLSTSGLGYFAVNTVLGAYIAARLFGVSFLPALVGVAVVQVVVAVIGHDFVHRVEQVLLAIVGALFLVITWYGIGHANFQVPADADRLGAGGVLGAFLVTVALSSSRMFGWSMCASDYTRYLRRDTPRGKVLLWTFLGAGVGGVWGHLIGAAIGTAFAVTSPTDLATALVPPGITSIALLALLGSTMSGAVLDIYSGSLGLLIADVRIRRWVSALATGVLGGTLGWWAGHTEGQVFGNIQNFLFLIGYWVGPWLGVTLTDLLLTRRREIDVGRFYDRRRRVRAGLVAFLIGLAASVPFMSQSLLTGPVAARFPQLGDIAYWVGGIVAALAYYLARRRERTPE